MKMIVGGGVGKEGDTRGREETIMYVKTSTMVRRTTPGWGRKDNYECFNFDDDAGAEGRGRHQEGERRRL